MIFGTEIGMDHRAQVGQAAIDTGFLQGTPKGVFPVVGHCREGCSLPAFSGTIFHLVANDVTTQFEMFGQVFLYLGDKAVSTPGRDRCRPCRELFGKRSGGIAL